MIIELPREIETQLEATAHAQGMTISQYIEALLSESNLRRQRLSEFMAAIEERMASLDTGICLDGEEVMAGLLAGIPSR